MHPLSPLHFFLSFLEEEADRNLLEVFASSLLLLCLPTGNEEVGSLQRVFRRAMVCVSFRAG